MELVVLTHPDPVEDEVEKINGILSFPNVRLHLRKPGFSMMQIRSLLHEINPEFHHKIIMHDHSTLYFEFQLKGVHLKYKDLIDLDRQTIKYISTSVHSMDEFNLLDGVESAFLGPVFDSISKPGYKSAITEHMLRERLNYKTSLIAIGGISSENLLKTKIWGFDGGALLGSIWSKKNTVKEFKSIHERWQPVTLD